MPSTRDWPLSASRQSTLPAAGGRTLSLEINGVVIYRQGQPVAFDEAALSESIRGQRDTHIRLGFSEGDAAQAMCRAADGDEGVGAVVTAEKPRP